MLCFLVYRELYKLHTNKNLKAHNALSFISDSMEHHKGRVLVITAKGDQIPHAQLAKREMVAERVTRLLFRLPVELMIEGNPFAGK